MASRGGKKTKVHVFTVEWKYMLSVQVLSAFLLLTTAVSQLQLPCSPHSHGLGWWRWTWVVSSPLFRLLHAVFTWSFYHVTSSSLFVVETSTPDILICILHLIKSNLWDLWIVLMLTLWGSSQPQLSAAGSISQACFSEWHQLSLILKCAAFFWPVCPLDVDLKSESTLGFFWEWKKKKPLAIDLSLCLYGVLSIWFLSLSLLSFLPAVSLPLCSSFVSQTFDVKCCQRFSFSF